MKNSTATQLEQLGASHEGATRKNLNYALYKKLLLIRTAEEGIQRYYSEDEMKTPMHMSMGEEAIAVGVCHALAPHDQVLGTYRSHAIYLAKTNETDRFFGELYGKISGVARGKAGSMHLSAPESGLMCCAAVVASTIPVAVGVAYANKVNRTGRMTAPFFGDGGIDAGVFWESLNFACLKKLPILFVCEDNDLAVHTLYRDRHGYSSITDILSEFDCNVFKETTTDVEKIYQLTRRAIRAVQETEKPAFLQLKYYRYLEHVGINEDFDAGYRPKGEFLKWYKVDPIRLQREKLLRQSWFSEAELQETEDKITEQVENSIKLAKAAPFPDKSELYSGIFA